MAERPELLGLATEIVSAHVSNNAIAVDQLPGLIQQVFNALATVEQATAAPPKPEPAVEVRVGLSRSHCLPRLRQAFFHAAAASDNRPQDDAGAVPPALGFANYVSLVAPNYAKMRSTLAKKIGLGRKSEGAPKKAARMSRKRGNG